jgi:hypothetical protein
MKDIAQLILVLILSLHIAEEVYELRVVLINLGLYLLVVFMLGRLLCQHKGIQNTK